MFLTQMTDEGWATLDAQTDQRCGCREGYKPQSLTIGVGTFSSHVPLVHEGWFSADSFCNRTTNASGHTRILTVMERANRGEYRCQKLQATTRL
jgi:hypothetical protein